MGTQLDIPESLRYKPILVARKNRAYRRAVKKNKYNKLYKTVTRTYNPYAGYVDYDYIDEKWQPVGQYIKYARASSAQTFLKHQNNKRIRRAKNVANGSAYKKHNEYWYDLF